MWDTNALISRSSYRCLTLAGVSGRFNFHSMENSGLNFRKCIVTNGTAFSGIPEKRTTLRSLPKFSEIPYNYHEFPFYLIFLPEFPELYVELFAFRKFNNFRIFWKLSPEICVPFVPISRLSEVLVEWKALSMRCALGQDTLLTHNSSFHWEV